MVLASIAFIVIFLSFLDEPDDCIEDMAEDGINPRGADCPAGPANGAAASGLTPPLTIDGSVASPTSRVHAMDNEKRNKIKETERKSEKRNSIRALLIGAVGALFGMLYYFFLSVIWLEIGLRIPPPLMGILDEFIYVIVTLGVAVGYWGLGECHHQPLPTVTCIVMVVLLGEMYVFGLTALVPVLGIIGALLIRGLEVAAMVAIFRVAEGLRVVFIAVAGWLTLSYMLSWLFSSYVLNLEIGAYGLSVIDHLAYAVAFGASVYLAREASKDLGLKSGAPTATGTPGPSAL